MSDVLRPYLDGNREALGGSFPLIYDELRRIARRHLRSEAAGHTLDTTALVHESYINLADIEPESVRDRGHFFAIASRVMRNILVDHARARRSAKRGGAQIRVTLTPELAAEPGVELDLIALHLALERLAERDPRLERVVECKVFGGMTTKETADALGMAVRTVEKDWTLAKSFLRRELIEHLPPR
jgi:RNA polymerase sigma factor (TIGR02999 family)